MLIELSAKQVREYAVPLIRECMGDEIGDRAEREWTDAEGDDTGVYAVFSPTELLGIGGIGSEISKYKLWLGYLAVRPSARGMGYGRLLLSNAENVARSAGYREMFIETYAHPTFEAAMQLYRSMGYEQAGGCIEYLDDGTDSVIYRKRL